MRRGYQYEHSTPAGVSVYTSYTVSGEDETEPAPSPQAQVPEPLPNSRGYVHYLTSPESPPPVLDAEQLFELGHQLWSDIQAVVDPAPHQYAWPELSPSQQNDLEGALVVLQQAMDGGSIDAAISIGQIYMWGQGVDVDEARALRAFKIGGDAGDVNCQHQVHSFLQPIRHEAYTEPELEPYAMASTESNSFARAPRTPYRHQP